MIKTKKEIEVTINGRDVQTLTDVCEYTRVYLHSVNTPLDAEQVQRIKQFLNEVFDKCQ
jgi:hypothetical protein